MQRRRGRSVDISCRSSTLPACDGVGVKQRPFNFVDAVSSVARVRDICNVLPMLCHILPLSWVFAALGAFPVYAMCVSLTL